MEDILTPIKRNFSTILQFSIWLLTIVCSFVFPPPIKFAGDEESVLRFSQFIVAAVIGFLIIILRSYSQKKYKGMWWKIAVFLFLLSIVTFIYYVFKIENETVIYPMGSKNRIVIGNSYLSEVQKTVDRDGLKSPNEVLSQRAVNPNNMEELYQVWPKNEITKNRIYIFILYVCSLTFFSLFVITLIQAIGFYNPQKTKNIAHSTKTNAAQ